MEELRESCRFVLEFVPVVRYYWGLVVSHRICVSVTLSYGLWRLARCLTEIGFANRPRKNEPGTAIAFLKGQRPNGGHTAEVDECRVFRGFVCLEESGFGPDRAAVSTSKCGQFGVG